MLLAEYQEKISNMCLAILINIIIVAEKGQGRIKVVLRHLLSRGPWPCLESFLVVIAGSLLLVSGG